LQKTVNKVLSESDPDTEPEGNTKNQDNIIGEDFHNLQEISTDKNLGISLEQFAPRTEMTKKKLEEIFKEEKNEDTKKFLIETFLNIPILAQHAFDMGKLKTKLTIRLREGEEVPRNTRIYPLNSEDTQQLREFVQYLQFHNLCERAKP